jgi:hypothetical protein
MAGEDRALFLMKGAEVLKGDLVSLQPEQPTLGV